MAKQLRGDAVEKRKMQLAVSMFSVRTEEHRPRMFESDLLLEVAAQIARRCLRQVVTMPAEPLAPDASLMDRDSGLKLPPASCAFKGCTFCVQVQANTDAEYRDVVDHPWDQALRAHVVDSHGEEIMNITEPFFEPDHAQMHLWDFYKGALSVQERLRTPLAGATIDRRVFTQLAHVCNDDRIRSLMCFLCSQIKLDTGRIRSEIEFRSARWLFSLPAGSLIKNFSMHKFNAKYRQPGSPLACRGPDHSADFSHDNLYLHPEVLPL